MNIGFYGDSYCATEHPSAWTNLLAKQLDATICDSGVPGGGLLQTALAWKKRKQPVDVAVICFTWRGRFYADPADWKWSFLKSPLQKPENKTQKDYDEFQGAFHAYYKWLFDQEEQDFHYERDLEWLMNLAAAHPETKFVYLPNNEYARTMCVDQFKGGALLDFTFEHISNNEPNSPGKQPCYDTRYCHMSVENNQQFANLLTDIVKNFYSHKNQIHVVDYSQFILK